MAGRSEPILERLRSYAHADPRRMGPHEVAMFLLGGAALSAAALAAVAWVAGYHATWRALVHPHHWKWLVLAPGAVLVSHIGYMVAYREVARLGQGLDLEHGHLAAMVATGFGPFNPRGGFAMDATSLCEMGLDDEEARLRVLVLADLEYALLAPAALVATLIMVAHHQRALAGLIPSWLIGVPAGAFAVLVLALIRWRDVSLGKLIDRFVHSIGVTLAMAARWPGGTIGWAGMAVYLAGEIATLGVCLAVFDRNPISLAGLVVGYATGYALTRRTLPLAGAGAVEAFMPFALTWVSIGLPAAVLTVVAYRVFNLWLTMIPAGAGLRHLRRNDRSQVATP